MGEHVQADGELMAELSEAGVGGGHTVDVAPIEILGDTVPVSAGAGQTSVPPLLAHAVIVRAS